MIREEGDYSKVGQKHQIKQNITPLKSSIQHYSKMELKPLCESGALNEWGRQSSELSLDTLWKKNWDGFLSGPWIDFYILVRMN